MESYDCIIIDDDEVARLDVIAAIKKFSNLNITGSYSSAQESLSIIEKEKVDIVFLDIDMPAMSGLEFRKKVMNIPVCVYITSHPEFALESFELDTLDYIVKPLQTERFAQTVKRIEEFMEIKRKSALYEMTLDNKSIYIKEGYSKTQLKINEIVYLEALKDYTLLITAHKRHCVLSSIGNILKEPYFQNFVRIHRSYAVSKQNIQKIGNHTITLLNNSIIPIGNSYKKNLSLLL